MNLAGKDAHEVQEPAQPDAERVFDGDVLAELSRLLADSDFGASERRRKMLSFVVTETLAGRGDLLKGTVLAQEVFARGAEFDPQTDPVVRIEARRLRRDLDCYYANFGARAPVHFAIPKGAYIPTFTLFQGAGVSLAEIEETGLAPDDALPQINPLGTDRRKWRLRLTRVGLALLLCLTVLSGVMWLTAKRPVAGPSSEPGLAIAPFEAIGGTADSTFLARGLSEQLVNDLMPFDGFRVYALPEDRTSLTEDNLRALKTDYGIEYIVTGTLRTGAEDGRVHLIAQMRRSDGQIVWSGDFDRHQTARDLMSLQDAMSKAIATTLGQTYGIVAKDIGVGAAQRTIPGDDTFSCLLRAHAYRRSFTSELRGQTADCLDAAVKRDPQSADVWAMRGWLKLDMARFEDITPAQRQSYSDEALDATSRAVALEPRNVLSLQARAAVLHFRGDFNGAERVMREALALNPQDPEVLHQLGWRLAVRGRIEEGVDYIRQAIALSIDPPPRYNNFIAIQNFLEGHYDEMLDLARVSADGDSSIGNALLAIANAKSSRGSAEAAHHALLRMMELRPELGTDPGAVFRQHGATDEISEALVEGLVEAGWKNGS